MAKSLRVALVMGSLDRGGAEKQAAYAARALCAEGVKVGVFSVTRDGFYRETLDEMGLTPHWFGRLPGPLLRLPTLLVPLARFRAHIVQSTHFFTNLYAALAARALGAISLGSVRSDLRFDLQSNPRWGEKLLRWPDALLTNSQAAKLRVEEVRPARVHLVPNVLDVDEFDRRAQDRPFAERDGTYRVAAVGSLIPVKRLDRFLRAIAMARLRDARIEGVIVGKGPEEKALRDLAAELQISGAVRFLGARDDVPAILRAVDALALTSDHEGIPNVVLEAMAAGLPCVATQVGGVPELIAEGVTGFLVPTSDEVAGLADRLARLAGSPRLSAELGAAARRRLEEAHGYSRLGGTLRSIYADVARSQRRGDVLSLVGAT